MRSLIASTVVLLLLGCNIQDLDFENIQGIKLDGVYAAPIGETIYTMSELLVEIGDTTELKEGPEPDNILYLEYTDQALFSATSDIVNISDVIDNASFNLPVTPPVGSNQTIVVDTTLYLEYAADQSERIDSVFYLSGDLTLDATLAGTTSVSATVTLPTTTNTTGTTQVSFGPSNTNFNTTRSLAGLKTKFTYQGSTNVIPVDVHLEIPLLTGQQIPAGETFNLQLAFQNQTFSEVYGKFGQDTVTVGNTTLSIPFFQDFNTEGFFLGAPTITFDFANSFGVPFGILFGGMYSVSDNTGVNDTTYLDGNITNSAQVVAAAQSPGETENTTIVVNSSNSSLSDLLATTPDQLGFNLQAVINPSDPNALNYISQNNQIQTDILVRMDLAVRLEDLARDVEFNLNGGLDFNEVDSAVLRVVTINSLPFSGTMEINIIGAASDTLFTAPEKLVLSAPFLNNNGTVRKERNNTADIVLGPDGVEALKTGTKVALHLVLNTSESLTANDLYVKIRLKDYIEIKASVVAGVNYQFNE
ncbi:MAG: hypothetical protein ACFHWX_20840 [Bacteroidota bacterium]